MSRPPNLYVKPFLGLAYLVILGSLLATSIAAYNKALPWQHAVEVSLTTTTPGLELNPNSDVKLQGLRVGVVREITSDGQEAQVVLELDSDKAHLIPINVDAAIVPKTLFGEKYVDLRVPTHASPDPIADGAVIRQTQPSVELGNVFSKLVPVLRALKPDQLSVTLSALANALDGRGETLAVTLNQLRQLAEEIDPHLETLVHDMRQFATTSDIYSASSDQLVSFLRSSAGISDDLLVPHEETFAEFLDATVLGVGALDEVLAANDVDIIRLSGEARPVLALLEEYSSGIGCFLEALHTSDTLLNQVVGAHGPVIDLTVDMVSANKPYTASHDLPTDPGSDAYPSNLPAWVPGWQPHCTEYAPWVYELKHVAAHDAAGYARPGPVSGEPDSSTPRDLASSAAVQEAREVLARAKAALALGVPQEDVPAFAELLVLPLIADGDVRVR